MIEYRTLRIALYPRKHHEQWICEYIIEREDVLGFENSRGSANGIFHSLKEAEEAASNVAKREIDRQLL
jgi:hypothetical protein